MMLSGTTGKERKERNHMHSMIPFLLSIDADSEPNFSLLFTKIIVDGIEFFLRFPNIGQKRLRALFIHTKYLAVHGLRMTCNSGISRMKILFNKKALPWEKHGGMSILG